MKSSIPHAVALLMTAVLLAFCVIVPVQLFHQADLRNAIDNTAATLDIARQRLRKQQQEYDEALAALPLMQADAARVAPEAEAAYAKEQDLRTQRKAMRAQNADLAIQLAELQAQMDAVTADAASIQSAITHLMDAANTLESLYQLYQ